MTAPATTKRKTCRFRGAVFTTLGTRGQRESGNAKDGERGTSNVSDGTRTCRTCQRRAARYQIRRSFPKPVAAELTA